jgi:hypothetical protein
MQMREDFKDYIRACPECEKKNILAALQPIGLGENRCPECYKVFPINVGRKVSHKELMNIIMGTK